MSLVNTVEKFSRFCRTGELDPSIQVNPERAKVYFKHIKNGIEDALKRAYPLTHHLLKKKRWSELFDAFLAKEDCNTPFLWRMPQFLVDFIKKDHWDKRFNLPYLNDLIDFEWVEIEIYMMPDCKQKKFRREGKLLDEALMLNPESCIRTYSYPVFEKKKLPRAMKKGEYPLLIFRHPEYCQVHFISLSPFFKTVLELIGQQLTGREALIEAAKRFSLQEKQALAVGEKFLDDLFEQHVIYGFTK